MNNIPFIYLAPLEGITEIEFRNLFARYFNGVDAAVAPFVSLYHHASDRKRRSWNIPPASDQAMKVIPQFMGRNISDFKHLAKWIKDRGYDELNWNLGCPVKRVVRRRRGCGMLQFPDEIRNFLDEALKTEGIKFSIKTRLGLENPDECYKLIEIYNQYPLKELILHPRIGRQLYSGEVMLDYFAECVKLSKNEIVYNGDIITIEDYQNIKSRFPSIRKIMIGRGLLKNPFLAEKIKGIIPENSLPIMNRFWEFHHELFHVFKIKLKNDDEILGKMKEYWHYFSYLFNDRNDVFKQIARSKNISEFQVRVKKLL